jgi:hypothetical protein
MMIGTQYRARRAGKKIAADTAASTAHLFGARETQSYLRMVCGSGLARIF